MRMEEFAELEIERITNLLRSVGVDEKRIEVLKPIIENTAWMKAKLDDAREVIATSNVVIPYDNGGGQKGIRENPLFKGYEALWKSYMSGMQKIIECLPADNVELRQEEEEKPKTMLELVRSKHKLNA